MWFFSSLASFVHFLLYHFGIILKFMISNAYILCSLLLPTDRCFLHRRKQFSFRFLHDPIDNRLLMQSSYLGTILQHYQIYGAGKIKSRFICVFLMVFSLPFSAVSLRVETCLLTDKKALFGESSSPHFGMTRRKTIKIAWQKISFDIIKMSEFPPPTVYKCLELQPFIWLWLGVFHRLQAQQSTGAESEIL